MRVFLSVLVFLGGSFFTFACEAFSVNLQFTNATSMALRAEGTVTYDLEGENETHWNDPTRPPIKYIPAGAQRALVDEKRTGLSAYFLEYFELFDENNHYVTNCLESYLPIVKEAVITFKLVQVGREHPRFYCSHVVE